MGCHPATGEKGEAFFTDDVSDVGYGLATHFEVPGGFEMQLYQPHYQKGSSE